MDDILKGCRVPDIALERVGGGTVNPADLRGQRLLVFVCPADAEAAKREIEAFRALACRFDDAGIWLLGIVPAGLALVSEPARDGCAVALARDDGRAWPHLAHWLEEEADADLGGAFLFERWGTLDQAWFGPGHAADALAAAGERD